MGVGKMNGGPTQVKVIRKPGYDDAWRGMVGLLCFSGLFVNNEC